MTQKHKSIWVSKNAKLYADFKFVDIDLENASKKVEKLCEYNKVDFCFCRSFQRFLLINSFKDIF
jgi:hypothetical protein